PGRLAALRRLLPHHADQFTLLPSPGPERFRVTGAPGRIVVLGTSPAVLLTGVHWYLTHVCRARLTWSGSALGLPRRLPAPGRPIERSATVPCRFAFNDTHDGYTAPYADWPRWERLIDITALHGCNQILVTAGQEAVYHRLLQDFGYSDAEARAWLPAPSHQPWWLLQNMSGYGGPVSPELLARRTALGRRICDRLRELGMAPVLPGYFGTVPDGFARRNPGARVVPQGTWAGLKRPDWLDPRTPVFAEVAAAFYRHQRELFGPVRHVKMDLLHEGGTPGDVPVPDAARAVEKALRTALPDAVWVILGWQDNPRRDLLDALDKRRMLIVDGLSDLEEVTDRERDWGGTPYAFGTIPNFGGRTTLGARTHFWSPRFAQWRDKPGSALVGTAYMAEATDRDPAAFALFSELAWRREPVDRAAWFAAYADSRYGGPDAAARRAFETLRTTVYEITSRDGRPHDSIFSARPSLTARGGTYWATHTPAFDVPDFDAALTHLLAARPAPGGSDAYRHDLTDIARQALANRSWLLLPHLRDAYERRDRAAFRTLSRLWLTLMRLADDMSGAHPSFLLGPWLAEARRMASGPAEEARLERTARVLITTWADRVTADEGLLANYANRDWHGLIGDFHLPQWRAYLDEVEDALVEDRPPRAFDWYALEEPWTRERHVYPVRPVSDAVRTARRVRDVLAGAPYQGRLTAAARPLGVAPGGSALITAEFRNTNGFAATGRVDFALTGPAGAAVEPQGPVSLPGVPAAGEGAARWRVTAPADAPRQPLTPLPYEAAVVYGPAGAERVRSAARGTLFLAAPPAAGWRAVSTNDAVFGQLGDRFAIDGSGTDLWRATAEFGALYRAGALAAGGEVTLRVDGQAATGPWARAGIVIRDDLADGGSRGFANLAVTPANGVVLSYDSDGDGRLDAFRRVTGVRAPVLLRLTLHAGGGCAGAFSTDGGATWRAVATVAVPGGARRDVGLFMSAVHGGATGVRGTATFSGWSLRDGST
ncbi:alpha-N-acetylglucosaminidase TIM-barrel domain-containing protein, partial [Streptomyces sp. URMC 123]|uniref:alpha-N-acetylglucosaminidase n=1 Tax=Streptomyces sp. URMC 123 TaxID=3423403 RepID=UPI003F1933C7